MTCRFLRPTVVFPPDARSWNDADVRRAMIHELEHVRRGDCLLQGVARLVCALYWFHPLVWVSWRRLGLEAERACDDAVLRRADATEYAEQLVALAERIKTGARMPLLAMANRSDLEARVTAVLDVRQRRGRPGALCVTAALMVAVLLLAVIAPLRAVSQIPRQPSQTTESPGRQELAFEVASIRPSDPDDRSGKFITMRSARQFVAKNYTVRDMVSAAYDLPPRLISGGPSWITIDRYEILAATPGVRPSTQEQMSMLRTLLASRFNLSLRREQRELPAYELTVTRTGAKLLESTPTTAEFLINRILPDNLVLLPARNVTIAQFASMLQRSVLDRPVVDKTELLAKYDFDLEWTRDETQFGGQLPVTNVDRPEKPDLFRAVQEQLGLRLSDTRARVEVIVIDRAERPTEN